jgi:hypothetical protein
MGRMRVANERAVSPLDPRIVSMSPLHRVQNLTRRTLLAVFLLVAAADAAQSQAFTGPLSGLLGRASYMNFFITRTSVSEPPLEPESGGWSKGLGFELAFELPGGRTDSIAMPAKPLPATDQSCLARYSRSQHARAVPCADTTVAAVTRHRGAGTVTYEEELTISPFSWKEPTVVLDLGLSFTQTGAFVSIDTSTDARVSLRELPAVTLYASFLDVPWYSDLPTGPSLYIGARSGLVSLYNGRAYRDTTLKFSGETLQVGLVAGTLGEFRGLGFFVEGAYLWRDFKSVDWETSAKLPDSIPRRINLSGATLLMGVQFSFRPSS